MWAIAGKEVVCLGDSTTHGGKVVSASSSVFYKGKAIARVGDAVTCPKCEGTHRIVSGAPSSFDNGNLIACNGDAVSCGARLISDGAMGGVVDDFLEWALSDKYFPGKGLPEEEVCAAVQAMLSSPQVQEGLKEMLSLTNENMWEYSAYIVETSPGKYMLTPFNTDKQLLSVTTGPAPPGAVAHIHTHPNSGLGAPSDRDWRYIRAQENKMTAYIVMGASGHLGVVNDEGEQIWCD